MALSYNVKDFEIEDVYIRFNGVLIFLIWGELSYGMGRIVL